MATVLLDQLIATEYGQFDLVWGDGIGFDGDTARFFADQVNGLVGAASGEGIYLHFASQHGGVQLRIVLLESVPEDSTSEWEDVVEVSATVPDGETPRWKTWAAEHHGPLALASGDYRVRVSARGREHARDAEPESSSPDTYLVEIWPAPLEPDAIVRTSTEEAAYWHREWGSRR